MISVPSVAVVILNWNGKHLLEKFLPSVLASEYDNLRIVVADNASTDDSISFLKQNYPDVTRLRSNTNEGFSKGYNTALKRVAADYYILLNSDVEVRSLLDKPVILLMESDEKLLRASQKYCHYQTRNI